MLYYQGNPISESTSRLHLSTAPDIVFCQNKIPDFISPPPYSRLLFSPLGIIQNKIGVSGFLGLYFEFQHFFLVGKNKTRVSLPCFFEENLGQVLGLRGGKPVKELAPYFSKWLTSQSSGCPTTVATLLPGQLICHLS